MKIGVFGGTFNPIHNGHINSLNSIQERLQFNHLFIVPASQNPLSKDKSKDVSSKQRLEMIQIALEDTPYIVDNSELQRGGLSFTIETLENYRKEYPNSWMGLIIGLDQFFQFTKWRDYKKILTESNLIVTSRPGEEFPHQLSDLNKDLLPLVENKNLGTEEACLKLKTGQKILFHQLKDVNISSTEIRKNIQQGIPIDDMVPPKVLNYIHANKLYLPKKSQ